MMKTSAAPSFRFSAREKWHGAGGRAGSIRAAIFGMNDGLISNLSLVLGVAGAGAEVLVLREDGSECGPDEPGELVHRGALVGMGYWGDAEKTAEVFDGTVYRTGDIGRFDAAGVAFGASSPIQT